MQLPEKGRKRRFISVINGKVEKVGEKEKGLRINYFLFGTEEKGNPVSTKVFCLLWETLQRKLLFSPTHLRIPKL